MDMDNFKSNLSNNYFKNNSITVSTTKVKEVLQELKSILEYDEDENKDENSISLYDVLKVMREKTEEEILLDRKLEKTIREAYYPEKFYLDIVKDYKNGVLIIRGDFIKGTFIKQNGDLILKSNDYYPLQDILYKCGDAISKRYDEFMENTSFYRDRMTMTNVRSTNSSFRINSDDEFLSFGDGIVFELKTTIEGKRKYMLDCNSYNLASFFEDNEYELFNKIFVKIDDCPKWSRKDLYKIRKRQLKRQQELERKKMERQQELERKEMKKQKRLALVKKLNPFRKK